MINLRTLVIKLGYKDEILHQLNYSTITNTIEEFLIGNLDIAQEDIKSFFDKMFHHAIQTTGFQAFKNINPLYNHSFHINHSYIVLDREGVIPYIMPESINTNIYDSFKFVIHQNNSVMLSISDKSFVTPFVSPSSKVDTSILIGGESNLMNTIYLKVFHLLENLLQSHLI